MQKNSKKPQLIQITYKPQGTMIRNKEKFIINDKKPIKYY